MEQTGKLTAADKFEIFEQMNLHQHYIDNDASSESAQKYISLYWPEAKMHVHDIRTVTFEGPSGMKQVYDYAHSVFPIHKWRHAVGSFEMKGFASEAIVEWRWIVSWKEDNSGTVSTGTYYDKFEKRAGIWKCIERKSEVDPNWPAEFFQQFVDREGELYKSS